MSTLSMLKAIAKAFVHPALSAPPNRSFAQKAKAAPMAGPATHSTKNLV
ncbi:hypothetical protein HUU05_17370 [candidate division KSB1 bacterium]|nr:hypothetical protein [candidate division KSB1 bacterium]